MPPSHSSDRPGAAGAEQVAAEHLAAEKQALRQQMRRARTAIPPSERAGRGRLVTSLLLGVAELRGAETVLAFSSFGSEVPTDELVLALWKRGVTVLLPFLESGEMLVAPVRPGSQLVETGYGPFEPLERGGFELRRIEAAIVPGLAFDRRGGRLGYGGGYYDRFLPQLPRAAARIGVGYAEQVVEAVPLGDGDVVLDLVVTDREVIRRRK